MRSADWPTCEGESDDVSDLRLALTDGQALCDRTMNVIERLNEQHATKMRYFLSKAMLLPCSPLSSQSEQHKHVCEPGLAR